MTNKTEYTLTAFPALVALWGDLALRCYNAPGDAAATQVETSMIPEDDCPADVAARALV